MRGGRRAEEGTRPGTPRRERHPCHEENPREAFRYERRSRWPYAAALLAGFLVLGVLPAYFLAEALFALTGRPPAPVAHLIVAAAAYVVFTFFALAGMRAWHRGRHGGGHGRHDPFGEIADALDRIAAGDFEVVLDSAGGRNGLAEKINRMAQHLSSMEHMRQDFVSDVSHEIQSPLTSIRGFAGLLKRDDLPPEERRRYAEVIEAEAGRLSRLGENLLKLSVLDSDPAAFAPKRYRLDEQIREILLMLEPQWSAGNIELDVDLQQVTLYGDEDLLGQVWINLLHNAIKFTPQYGKIGVRLRREGKDAVCTVTDTGIGIPEEDLIHIFERFYKADRSRSSAGGGSGLGLALAKKIAAVHGGGIAAKSAPGAGSTFTVRLPEGESPAE